MMNLPPVVDLYSRAAALALELGARVLPTRYVVDLAAYQGQVYAVGELRPDEADGAFVVTGLTYSPAAGDAGLTPGALVELEAAGLQLVDEKGGGVALSEVAAVVGSAAPWRACPAFLPAQGELKATVRLEAGKSVQAGESLTVYGFHASQDVVEQMRGCWGVGPYWLRQVLTSTANVPQPDSSRELVRSIELARVTVSGGSDALELEAGLHRIQRGHPRDDAAETPSSPTDEHASLWPLLVTAGRALTSRKRDASSRTTVVTWHGTQL